jgi:hypothetical protein
MMARTLSRMITVAGFFVLELDVLTPGISYLNPA